MARFLATDFLSFWRTELRCVSPRFPAPTGLLSSNAAKADSWTFPARFAGRFPGQTIGRLRHFLASNRPRRQVLFEVQLHPGNVCRGERENHPESPSNDPETREVWK